MFQDVERLLRDLPKVISVYKVPHNKFNHLDFVWATDIKPLLYDNIITTLNDLVTRT